MSCQQASFFFTNTSDCPVLVTNEEEGQFSSVTLSVTICTCNFHVNKASSYCCISVCLCIQLLMIAIFGQGVSNYQ
jgi:hypothetical protein